MMPRASFKCALDTRRSVRILPHMKIAPLIILATSVAALADVRLPAIISDNMVLLQDSKSNVWGWADAGEKVTVKLGDATASATADEKGRWSVKMLGLKPGVAGEMTISGKNSLVVKNVAVGEVWLASGQSNMEWVVKNAKDAEQEIADCKFPDLRVFTVVKKGSETPLDNVTGKWDVATPENAPLFSAVGYYFSREVHKKLKVPVGLINSSWGGTPVETWIPASGINSNPEFSLHWKKKVESYPHAKAAFDEVILAHKASVEKAKTDNTPVPKAPRAPDAPTDLHAAPMGLFNGMIAPLAPYTIRGAIWYQGESNAGPTNRGNMPLYGPLFATMILSWRFEFARAQNIPREESEFSFLFVQLANFYPTREEPTDSYWAQIREAQLNTLEVPRTEMAVTIDIGEAKDIHPKNKQDVGKRLALAALAGTYFEETEYSGPIYGGMQQEDGKIRLNFSHAEGLKPSAGDKIEGFAVAGEDKKFYWADVALEGDHVVVSSPKVPAPVAVRYGWADNPNCNLVNSANLPASPFRTDKWEQNPPVGSAGN